MTCCPAVRPSGCATLATISSHSSALSRSYPFRWCRCGASICPLRSHTPFQLALRSVVCIECVLYLPVLRGLPTRATEGDVAGPLTAPQFELRRREQRRREVALARVMAIERRPQGGDVEH